MKKFIIGVCLFVLAFTLGVYSTVSAIDMFMMDGLVEDATKLYLEGFDSGYTAGLIDEQNGNMEEWKSVVIDTQAYFAILEKDYNFIG